MPPSGALGRGRTYGTRIRSPLLYPLSYERMRLIIWYGVKIFQTESLPTQDEPERWLDFQWNMSLNS